MKDFIDRKTLYFMCLWLGLTFMLAEQMAEFEPWAQPLSTATQTESSTLLRGLELYTEYCAGCHGYEGEGGQTPSLKDDRWEFGGGDADILKIISTGNTNVGMPGFGDVLSVQDKSDLLAYIRKGARLETTPPVVDVPSVADKVQIKDWVVGLDEPWGIAFTGPKAALITEKKGDLRIVESGRLLDVPVMNVPLVYNKRQGGLLDVAIDPDYAQNGWVYLGYAHALPAAPSLAMTRIVRGRIKNNVFIDMQVLFEARSQDYIATGFHFGTRITFDKQGHLYFSIGDRGKKDEAQDLSVPNGKIHRINTDGSIPQDNPFVDDPSAYSSIYALGNRNPQGLIIHPETGVLWETEHGPKGGDELNVIKSGVNYGWPKISYGRNYNGTVLTPYTALAGLSQPASQWTPSIAVCGLDVYTGDLFPHWKGRLMAGALKYQTVRLIDVKEEAYVSETTLIEGQGKVRDVTTGPDGAIYVALPTKIVRLSPKS